MFVAGVLEAELLVAVVASRLYNFSQGDEVDAECAPFCVNSSLAPVLSFFVGVLSL